MMETVEMNILLVRLAHLKGQLNSFMFFFYFIRILPGSDRWWKRFVYSAGAPLAIVLAQCVCVCVCVCVHEEGCWPDV